MRSNPRPQEMYRHFKGNLYQIRCLAKNSETGEMMVVYQAMYDTFQIYVRPLAMFMEEVDHVKYPNVKQRYRFELLQDADGMTEDAAAAVSERQMRESRAPESRAEKIQAAEKTQLPAPEASSPQAEKTAAPAEEQVNIDPMVMEFLDADTYEQRLHILAALRDRITDDMINTMAVAVDLEIKDGSVEERYEELKNCLLTFEKYECNRLR